MTNQKNILFGFHAVTVRLKAAPDSVQELHIDTSRKDQRMQRFLEKAEFSGVRLVESNSKQLDGLAKTNRHQGVVAIVEAVDLAKNLTELLDGIEGMPLLLVLDGVTDPHNLGACLRVADGVGAHAVIAPKDRAVGINATVAKVASGAAETVPYLMVTNLSRTLKELKEREIWCVGTSDAAEQSIYTANLNMPLALVLGAEGGGMRRLTRENCDFLVSIPMRGAVESLNVSVASGVCLYEAIRQRGKE